MPFNPKWLGGRFGGGTGVPTGGPKGVSGGTRNLWGTRNLFGNSELRPLVDFRAVRRAMGMSEEPGGANYSAFASSTGKMPEVRATLLRGASQGRGPQPYQGRGINVSLPNFDIMGFVRQHPQVLKVAGFVGVLGLLAHLASSSPDENAAMMGDIRAGVSPQELYQKYGKGADYEQWLRGTYAAAKALVEEEAAALVKPQSFPPPGGAAPTGPGGPGGAPGAPGGFVGAPGRAPAPSAGPVVGGDPQFPTGMTGTPAATQGGTPFSGIPAGKTPATEEQIAGTRSSYRNLQRALGQALESIGVAPGVGDWSRWMQQWTAPEAIAAMLRDVPSGASIGGRPGLEETLQARAKGGPITASRVEMMRALQESETFIRGQKGQGRTLADIIKNASGLADKERITYLAPLLDREYDNADELGELLAMVLAGNTGGKQGTNPVAIGGFGKIYGNYIRRATGSTEKPPNEDLFKYIRGLVLSPEEQEQVDQLIAMKANPEFGR